MPRSKKLTQKHAAAQAALHKARKSRKSTRGDQPVSIGSLANVDLDVNNQPPNGIADSQLGVFTLDPYAPYDLAHGVNLLEWDFVDHSAFGQGSA